jgi:GNAT superfamily N-acetyltransferase
MTGLEIRPVTRERWPDLVELFERPGPRGAWARTSACYCMFWRLRPDVYEAAFRDRSLEAVGGGPNKDAMAEIVARGAVPGLVAYRHDRPIGWVAVSARAELVRLEHTRQFRPADDDIEPAWSISCFYVHRSDWRSGVGAALLAAAAERAVEHGAAAIEGYPVKAGSIDPYTGYDTMFAAAGFELVRPARGKGRALWRKQVSG